MPNLADSHMRESFVRSLEKCESYGMQVSEWESNFIKDIRMRFEGREDLEDMGLPAWNPTANQWNTLKGIEEKYR